MINEKYIKSRIGDKNPFKVPEGYFEQLTTKVISNLPEQPIQQKTTLIKRLRPWISIAACICIAIFSITLYFNHKEEQMDTLALQQNDEANDTYIDEITDYAMLDNEDIYYNLLADI